MGIKERREREKHITRQAILTAALEIARQEGWSALTIRKVGEHIEYSAPMVYEYFKNKEDILLALLQDGFRQLTAAMQQARNSAAEGEERALNIADAYWRFAMSQPELYQLMHGMAGVSLDKDAIAQAVQEVCTITEETVLNWARTQNVTIKDPLGAAEIIWSLLHGLTSVTLASRIKGGEQRARDLVHHAIRSQLAGWKITSS